MKRHLLAATALTALISPPAFAQVVEQPAAISTAGRATIYQRAYFDRYGPSNALDMAKQVPGFQLDLGPDGDGPEVRGFAGAAGNVVINGARPSSKSESLATTLQRIPASRVSRIEVQPGDLYGSDYAGKAQVLNVVLTAEGGFDATVTGQIRHRYEDKWVPDLAASALWKRGNVTINASAGSQVRDELEEGFDRVTTIDGDEIEYRRKFNDIRDRSPFVSLSGAWEEAPDRAIRANIRYERNPYVLKQRNRVTPIDGPAHDDGLILDYFNDAFEVGGDITRPLAGGAIKFVGLATRRNRDNFDAYYGRDAGGDLIGGFEQATVADRDETLGRLVWNRSNLAGFSVELGAEYVFNILKNDLQLSLIESDGDRTPVELPIAQATVSEKRAQFFANVGRSITSTLRADATLAYETSRLKVRGDATADRSLSFFKPGLTLDWRPKKGGWHAQLSVKRTVAQLDFFDFVSSAELANDRVNGGNANLLPQRAWEARALIEHPILGDGLARLEVGVDRISLLQDRVLTEEGFDAPGNLGDGRRRFAALTIDAPLAQLGLKGARLKLNGQVQRTRVFDPVSGSARPFSGFWPKWQWNAEYRHDIGEWSYGGAVSHRADFCFYRTDETDCNGNVGVFGSAFVEYRPTTRTTITLDIDNLFSTHGDRTRSFSIPNRSVPPQVVEYRDRNGHRAFGLTVKQQLG